MVEDNEVNDVGDGSCDIFTAPLTPIIRTSSATGSSANLIGIINNDEVDGGGGGELTEVRWPLPN